MSRRYLKARFNIGDKEWLTSNMRLHWREKYARTLGLKNHGYYGGWYALAAAKISEKPVWNEERPCRVVVTVRPPTARRFDPPNASPTVKALIDGLTLVGFWADDNGKIIKGLEYRGGEPTGTKGIYWVTIEAEDWAEEGVQA